PLPPPPTASTVPESTLISFSTSSNSSLPALTDILISVGSQCPNVLVYRPPAYMKYSAVLDIDPSYSRILLLLYRPTRSASIFNAPTLCRSRTSLSKFSENPLYDDMSDLDQLLSVMSLSDGLYCSAAGDHWTGPSPNHVVPRSTLAEAVPL